MDRRNFPSVQFTVVRDPKHGTLESENNAGISLIQFSHQQLEQGNSFCFYFGDIYSYLALENTILSFLMLLVTSWVLKKNTTLLISWFILNPLATNSEYMHCFQETLGAFRGLRVKSISLFSSKTFAIDEAL